MRIVTLQELSSKPDAKVQHLATLHREESYRADPPISLSGHLAGADEQHMTHLLTEGFEAKSPALDLYAVSDALVSPNSAVSVGDCIIADSLRPYLHLKHILPQFAPWISKAEQDDRLELKLTNLRRISRPVLLLRDHGEAGYFHFIHSVLPRLLLWRQLPAADIHIAASTTFQTQFLEYLNVPKDRIHLTQGRSYFCDQAYMITGVVRPDWSTGGFFERPLEVTRQLRRLVPKDAEYSGARVYISRRDSPIRAVQNESDLEETLQDKLGFQPVVLSEITVEQQIRTFAGASIVVGAHGAGLSNASFMRDGATLFEIFPKSRIWPTFRAIASRAGLRYAAHVSRHADRYDTDELVQAIGQVLAAA